jgi:hypothetical protein
MKKQAMSDGGGRMDGWRRDGMGGVKSSYG